MEGRFSCGGKLETRDLVSYKGAVLRGKCRATSFLYNKTSILRGNPVHSAPMKTATGIWDVLTNTILFLLGFALLVAVGVWYAPLIKQNQTMRADLDRLKAEVASEQARSHQLGTTLKLLNNDRRSQERLIREHLGYARPGETVFRFVEPSAAPVAPATTVTPAAPAAPGR